MTVEHMDQSFPMVSHSLGYTIAFLPDGCELPTPTPLYLTPLRIQNTDSVLTRPTWLIYQKKKVLSPQVIEFLDYIQQNVVEKI